MSEKTKPIKKLYSFEVTYPKDSKVYKFFIKKPGNDLIRQGELYHYKTLNTAIREGLLPQVLISKRFSNDSGILSDLESEQYNKSYEKLAEITKQLALLDISKPTELSKEDETKIEEAGAKVGKSLEDIKDAAKNLEPDKLKDKLKEKLIVEREELRKTIQRFETEKTSLFNISAESFSRNKTVMWWIFYLSYQEDDKGNFTPFYTDGTFEQRLEFSDQIEEGEDEFLKIVVKRFLFAISFWFYSGTTKQEDFEKAEKDFNI